MKVTEVKTVLGPDRAKATEAPAADVSAPKDRVSVQATKEAEAKVAVARAAAGNQRAARMEKLEAEVRSGTFRPDASRVAAQILADAEIDARLAALLRH